MPSELIDVRDVIARHSPAEHAGLADAYFARMSKAEVAALLRKPFFDPRAAPSTVHGLYEVLSRLHLFSGVEVLDFGAGSGWLSKVLASIDCRPVAVDVSRAALDLGRDGLAQDPLSAGLVIDWRVYDGLRLPLDDASVDRVVSFDAFHHVADQAATLAEFHRVLRVGGLAVFREPGPQHSSSWDAQLEMRRWGVIENNIELGSIWQAAEAVGFCNLQIAAAMPRSATFCLEQYNRVISEAATAVDGAALLAQVVHGADNLRIFSLEKSAPLGDSRSSSDLAHTLTVSVQRCDAEGVVARARVTNTGKARWRASVNEPGGVCLGVREWVEGNWVDCGRVWLSGLGVDPGQTVEVGFTLPAPSRQPARLEFDLVAEYVTWFGPLGSKPVVVEVG